MNTQDKSEAEIAPRPRDAESMEHVASTSALSQHRSKSDRRSKHSHSKSRSKSQVKHKSNKIDSPTHLMLDSEIQAADISKVNKSRQSMSK